MAEQEAAKKKRAAAKTSLTKAARKLQSSIKLGLDNEALDAIAVSLEQSFEKLCDTHDEYTEYFPEDENAEDYLNQAETVYMDARKAHVDYCNDKSIKQCRKNFVHFVDRLKNLLDRLDAVGDSVCPSDTEVDLMSEIGDKLDPLLGSASAEKDKLSGLTDADQEETEAHELVLRVDKAKIKINLAVKQLQRSSFSPPSSAPVQNPNSVVTSSAVSFPQNSCSNLSGPASPGGTMQASTTQSLPGVSVCAMVGNSASQSAPHTVSSPMGGTSVSVSQGLTPISVPQVGPGVAQPPASPTSQVGSVNRGFGGGQVGISGSVVYSPPHTFSLPADPTQVTPWVSPNSHISSNPVHTKKPNLPTFSGERSDWSEFKYVWRSLAEKQFTDNVLLAYELKKACSRGKASESIKHIPVTSDSAYDELWTRLSEEYDDQGLSVQAALNRLMSLKSVDDREYKKIVRFIDIVEGVHNELRELAQLEAISMVDVDRLSHLLPHVMHIDWMRRYRDLPEQSKIRPFAEFVRYLKSERSYMARLAESSVQHSAKKSMMEGSRVKHSTGSHGAYSASVGKSCVLHGNRNKHSTLECNTFKKMTSAKRQETIRKARRCYRCFGEHFKAECKENVPSCKCGSDHHPLVCQQNESAHRAQDKRDTSNTHVAEAEETEKVTDGNKVTGTYLVSTGAMALYPIHRASVVGKQRPVTVFMDGGSNASYITEKCATTLNLRKVEGVTLDVTTVGGEEKEFKSSIYEVPLRSVEGKSTKLLVYSLDRITGPLSPLDKDTIQGLFPDFDAEALMRQSNTVDLLIGTDYFGLHPKQEVARVGENLSIMRGELGICLVGTHPDLREGTKVSGSVPRRLNGSYSRVGTNFVALQGVHEAFRNPQSFIAGEELGTECVPKCGACRCGKCPIPGHSLSFKEEQELHMIRSNLTYCEDRKCWVTSYPWLKDPDNLPNNFASALATLKSTEKSLLKDPAWAPSYKEQIDDMVSRKAARKLTPDEVNEWRGPVFYVSHLAVANAKSKSTPVRIVFNSSQTYRGVSLNSCLAKGPDSYANSLLGVLLRWRENEVAIVGDIRKMFHSVFLEPLEQHCHRFLWRDLDTQRKPDTYVMERVNMGDRPAPAIATEALFKTADLCKDDLPRAAEFIQKSSYVDDLIDSVETMDVAVNSIARDTEKILAAGGFEVKNWQLSGHKGPLHARANELKGSEEHTGVLGVMWHPSKDTITHAVTLNFSAKKHGAHTGPDLRHDQIPESLPVHLSRRQVLQQVMGIYDPMGIASPFTLLAKVYLRETWQLKLDWDDPLPAYLYNKWREFFSAMFDLEKLQYPRCLRPEDAVGNPWLVILSDGSDTAYGCAAYARWQTEDGNAKLRLIMAKSRIAPVDRVSTPRMELNGAVLSKRCRAVIEKEMRYTFDRVLHLIDSETVLNMLHKTSCRFKVYEGVRIGEIQAAAHGDMSEWAWISTQDNTADWLTRGRSPKELDADSDWFCGPAMLRKPFQQWNIRFGKTSDEPTPGEKKIATTHVADAVLPKESLLDHDNFSSAKKAVRVIGRVIGIARSKSFKGGHIDNLSAAVLKEAEEYLVKEAQSTVDMRSPDYRRLNPACNAEGVWVVGASRLSKFNPMGAIHSELPRFLPRSHPLTKLAMTDAHKAGHRGRDATLARFRTRFWTPRASALAKMVKNQCQLCRMKEAQMMEQAMGALPEDRTRPSPPFNHSMVDLFGPYLIRGEVQKRTSGKAWGMILTDLCSRAVHIEAMYGYDASNTLLALSRFASVRGWPERIYSDPGSQLIAASKEINDAAARAGVDHGLEWVVGPADSPWRQGAVESLVAAAKKAIHIAVSNQRLSASEFLTVCTEAANTINERPIGLLPAIDSEINVLTPNCLLLGRATAANPSGWQPGSHSLKTRYHLVSAIGQQFWEHWIQLYAPLLVSQQKWFSRPRELKVGDVVLVADSNTLKGEYRLAIVTETHPSRDGHIRSATVSYKNFKVSESVRQYKGAPYTAVRRSVQRMALLVPVAEMRGEAGQVGADDELAERETGKDAAPVAQVSEEWSRTKVVSSSCRYRKDLSQQSGPSGVSGSPVFN